MTPDEELVDDGTDADFDAGFTGTTGKPPETPEASKEATTPAATTPGETTGTTATTAPPVAPEYVQFTKAEADELRAAAAKTAAYDKQLASINGSIGFLKQNIKPPVDPVKDGAAPTPTAETDPMVRQREAIVQHEMDVLTAEFPNWREIVGAPEQGGVENVNKAHPFRVWLAAQAAEYQAKINNANSSVIIMRAIEKFNDDTAKAAAKAKEAIKPSPQIVARKAVIKDAIQPRGDGGQPPPAKSEDDHFAEGFATG